MRIEARSGTPFFSVCIPQHNRTSFLLEALRSLAKQDFRDFEVCISDDRSDDGREEEVISLLKSSGMNFVYQQRESNGRYDANLRSAIGLASGRFCFLLGNDDCFTSDGVLSELYADMQRSAPVSVVIPNFERFETGLAVRRVMRTGIAGSGAGAAVAHFRSLSFVSGIVLETASAQAQTTARWDGSEMYQMYLGCRLLALGGRLLTLDRPVVREGIRIAGESVDSYARKPKLRPCPVIERPIPLARMGALVVDAVDVPPGEGRRRAFGVFWQILVFTYPFWIIEYRRVQSWKYALGICIGMRPRRLLSGITPPVVSHAALLVLYGTVTSAALLTPVVLFDVLKGRLYRFAKSFR